MILSNDLISQFSKILNDNKPQKTGNTIQGIAVKQDDSVYVKLDGSDQLTPVSTTSDVKNGDVVSVLIKNHSAIITGNITSPSARAEDIPSYGELSKVKEDYNNLKTKVDDIEYSILLLDQEKLSSSDAEKNYANVNMGNITTKGFENFYANSGLITDASILEDGTISGTLKITKIDSSNTPISEALAIDNFDSLSSNKTLIGSVLNSGNSTWYNIISVRHRNGSSSSDGNKYGLEMYSPMTREGNLSWRQQVNGTWGSAKVLLDKNNIQTYNGVIGVSSIDFSNSQASKIETTSNGGFSFKISSDGTKIVFDGDDGKIWRVSPDGTKTALTD